MFLLIWSLCLSKSHVSPFEKKNNEEFIYSESLDGK